MKTNKLNAFLKEAREQRGPQEHEQPGNPGRLGVGDGKPSHLGACLGVAAGLKRLSESTCLEAQGCSVDLIYLQWFDLSI